jgi:ribosomal protein S6--L-glutamate ligase
MRIGVLSRNSSLYSTRRLVEAGRQRGHTMLVIDTMGVVVELGLVEEKVGLRQSSSQATMGGLAYPFVRLPQVDAIVPRIGASITNYGLAVVRQFEAASVPTTASSLGVGSSRDKLYSLQLMTRSGLPVPRTAVLAQPHLYFSAVQSVGGPPVIIKLNRGTQGRGVILAPNFRTVEVVLSRLRRLKQLLLVQEFVAEAEGSDVRVIVVGGRCVAAMRRTASAGEYRSNLHRGGTAVSVTLSAELEQLACRAAQAHDLDVAGVDIIHSRRGPLLLEVNSSPGLEGIEQATQADVAGAIIEHLEEKVAT